VDSREPLVPSRHPNYHNKATVARRRELVGGCKVIWRWWRLGGAVAGKSDSGDQSEGSPNTPGEWRDGTSAAWTRSSRRRLLGMSMAGRLE
jgi:hypothetical protein